MLHAAKIKPGDVIDRGTRHVRFGMDGDTYMNSSRLVELAETLDRHARTNTVPKPEWIPQTAVRLRLADPGVAYLDALYILAAAHVTWSDILWMKS